MTRLGCSLVMERPSRQSEMMAFACTRLPLFFQVAPASPDGRPFVGRTRMSDSSSHDACTLGVWEKSSRTGISRRFADSKVHG